MNNSKTNTNKVLKMHSLYDLLKNLCKYEILANFPFGKFTFKKQT